MIVNAYTDPGLWPVQRADQLSARFHELGQKDVIRWTWAPAPATVTLNYFASGPDELLASLEGFEYVPHDEVTDWSGVDVLILTAHGADMAVRVMEYRRRHPKMVVLLWLWDNHLAHMNNLKTVMTCDMYFASHAYDSAYLNNLSCPEGMHVPACSAQWTVQEARELLSELSGVARSSQLLLNYVDYKFSWRSELLAKLRAELDQADSLLMPSHDRGRYFGKSSKERLAEWVGHKATLILPVQRDLSTRVFDALLAGLVVIAPRMIADFDVVFPPEMQERLGMVRIDDFEMPTIRAAIEQANANFDRLGEEGVKARSDFILEGHMLSHRMHAMLRALRMACAGRLAVRLTGSEHLPLGLRFVTA